MTAAAVEPTIDMPIKPSVSPEFILAGKAIVTVQSVTGERYTFKVTRSKPKEGSVYTQPAWFVSLLTGPSNETDYTYLGMLNPDTFDVRLTKASKYQETSKPVRVARWALNKVLTGLSLPAGYAIHHEGRCGRCGRLLTVPESITSGFGPECIQFVK